MPAFILAFTGVMAAAALASIGLSWEERALGEDWRWVGALVDLWAIPTYAALVTALALNTLSPRRLFDARVRRTLDRAALGAFAAVLALVAFIVAIPVLPADVPGWVVPAGSPVLITAALIALRCARTRKGHCHVCGFDARACPHLERCTECGAWLDAPAHRVGGPVSAGPRTAPVREP